MPQRLAEVGRRLQRVQVKNLLFEDVMRRYDSRDTLFLLDPPYRD
jgi:site-specific DNA-adenine methylase